MSESSYHHNEAQLRAFYRLPAHAPLLPFQVDDLVADVRMHAAKRGAAPEVVALAQRLRTGGKPA